MISDVAFAGTTIVARPLAPIVTEFGCASGSHSSVSTVFFGPSYVMVAFLPATGGFGSIVIVGTRRSPLVNDAHSSRIPANMSFPMRTVSRSAALVLSLAGCSRGHTDPNPAPAPAAAATVNMAGRWRVTAREIVSTNTSSTEALRVGSIVDVAMVGGTYVVTAVQLDATTNAPVFRNDIEDGIGFGTSWYQNSGNGSSLAFGYGWDRLASAGGGTRPDYLQYGVRVIAANDDVLIGYEAQRAQDSGGSLFEWVVQIQLVRTP